MDMPHTVGISGSSIDCGVDWVSIGTGIWGISVTISTAVVSISSGLGLSISRPLAIVVSMSVVSTAISESISVSVVSQTVSVAITVWGISIAIVSIGRSLSSSLGLGFSISRPLAIVGSVSTSVVSTAISKSIS